MEFQMIAKIRRLYYCHILEFIGLKNVTYSNFKSFFFQLSNYTNFDINTLHTHIQHYQIFTLHLKKIVLKICMSPRTSLIVQKA